MHQNQIPESVGVNEFTINKLIQSFKSFSKHTLKPIIMNVDLLQFSDFHFADNLRYDQKTRVVNNHRQIDIHALAIYVDKPRGVNFPMSFI